MKNGQRISILIFAFILISFFGNAQISTVFYRFNNLPNSPIYQSYAGLFGVGFTNSNLINSQLTITNSSPTTPLMSLYRKGNYFYTDFDGTYSKSRFNSNNPLLVMSTKGGVYLGENTDYSTSSRLNIEVNCTSSSAISGAIDSKYFSDYDYGYNLLLTVNRNLTKAFAIQTTLSNSEAVEVFKIYGDGSTTIGEKEYNGIYGKAKLNVDGLIAAKELVVNTTSWADFVFDKNYKLITLTELQNYIDKNKHLPGIPAANEVILNGYSVGEMDKILLQKIEELTIYIIELKKEVDIAKCNRK